MISSDITLEKPSTLVCNKCNKVAKVIHVGKSQNGNTVAICCKCLGSCRHAGVKN